METTTIINGIPVKFPFEPYEIQKAYMQKVIDCLQNSRHGVLESPTGTGKTLSLLCASLAWLEVRKAQVQLQRQAMGNEANAYVEKLSTELDNGAGAKRPGRSFIGLPTIIYASRTHSQLSQAMQELKRTSYNHMKAYCLGSREQMCIHPEVIKEQSNSLKTHLCRLKIKSRSCHLHNNLDRKKRDLSITNLNIIDIEDMVKLGEAHKFCPYYMTKELKEYADIIFMPYNYLLDPKVRKSLGIELQDNAIILDEAHNIDQHCEASASIDFRSTDISLCVDEITTVMKVVNEEIPANFNEDAACDFTPEDLCNLKELFLKFEKELDAIELTKDMDGLTAFNGAYIFEFFEKISITYGNVNQLLNQLERIIQFLATVNDGPFQRRGIGLQLFTELLSIVFASQNELYKQKINTSYKVHIQIEEPKKRTPDNWLSKMQTKTSGRVLSYWCFSPGFGEQVRCVILTSGTLAPLKPLITELEMKVEVTLENPHIIGDDQVCVKILKSGPDNEPLNCNFQNRDNLKYIASLGRSILNLIRIIPNGVLIFFQSYPIMMKYQNVWQQNGIWASINNIKPIYVEPRDKNAFNATMLEYYSKINDPTLKGAIFMGVFRGKVSEGLDFADINGRAVIITGLPFPPLKDPRVILKKRYLDIRNARDKQFQKGQEWYSLEACRAVNQAVGRVIRHRHDYGAIILMDSRFDNNAIQQKMSKWLQKRIEVVNGFGQIMKDIRDFFRNAQLKFPNSTTKCNKNLSIDLSGNSASSSTSTSLLLDPNGNDGTVMIHKRNQQENSSVLKRRKIMVVPNPITTQNEEPPNLEASILEAIAMARKLLNNDEFKQLVDAMDTYKKLTNIDGLIETLRTIFTSTPQPIYFLQRLQPYFTRKEHLEKFKKFCEQMK